MLPHPLLTPLGTLIKSTAKAGTGPIARRLTGTTARILMYHRFAPADSVRRLSVCLFERQLQYLVRHFRVRRLSDVVRALREGRKFEEPTAVLTVDDGYADFGEYAYPLLQRYQVPVTLFVVTDFLDGCRWLWFDANHYVLQNTRVTRYEVCLNDKTLHLDLSSIQSRNDAWSAIGEQCLRMNTTQRTAVLQRLQDELKVVLPDIPTRDYRALSWKEAERLDPRLVQFGAHTCTHPVLSRSALPEIEYEVRESKRIVETRLEAAVPAFCYPNGEPDDYDDRSVQAVKAAGYSCATVAHGGLVGPEADVYRLERIGAVGQMRSFRGAVNGFPTIADKWRAWRHAATS